MSEAGLRYRPEIDGLRAIAVLAVILFHAGFLWIPGGFLGVDIFFVISGYVITANIKRSIEVGNFHFAAFYERRIRRILPAVVVVVLASIFPATLWLTPVQFREFSGSVFATQTFWSNFYFYFVIDYFNQTAATKSMLHMWSLSVEEQFYLFYPVILIALYRLAPRHIVYALAASLSVSLSLACYLAAAHPGFNFYSPASRAWELLAGALCAFAPIARWRNSPAATWGAWCGLIAIISSFFMLDEHIAMPSLPTVLPVSGMMLLILFAKPDLGVGKLLSLRPFVALGLISYGAYLWHQPIFAFARLYSLSVLSSWVMLGLIGLTVVLATISYHVIERPFRYSHSFLPSRRRFWLWAAAVTASLSIFGAIGYIGMGLPARLNPRLLSVLRVADESPSAANCHTQGKAFRKPREGCIAETAEQQIVVWGDSHANMLVPALSVVAERSGHSLRQLSYSSCAPVQTMDVALPDAYCAEYNREALAYIVGNAAIDTVFLAARWRSYVDGRPFDNGEGGVELSPALAIRDEISGDLLSTPSLRRTTLIENGLLQTVVALQKAGKRVVLIYPVPEAGWNVPDLLFRQGATGQVSKKVSISKEIVLQRGAATRSVLDNVVAHTGAAKIDPLLNLCEAERCSLMKDGASLYRDDNHLSRYGSQLLIPTLLETMAPNRSANLQ